MRLILVATAAVALAGCGSGASGAAVVRHTAPVASASPSAGPFRIKVDHCGALSASQRDRYSTNDRAGLIVTVTRRPGPGQLAVSVAAEFLHGKTVEGTNTTGRSTAEFTAGQSQRLEIDNLTGSHPGNPRDRCKLTGYASFTAAGFQQWPIG